jgi:hypothetical protein
MKPFKKFVVLSTLLFLLLAVPFTFIWNDHTTWVQDMVATRAVNYQEPNWLQIDAKVWSTHAFNVTTGMSGGWDEKERYDYLDSIYDVIFALSNNPEEVGSKIEAARVAYDKWKDSLDYFVNNRLYAMYYTF